MGIRLSGLISGMETEQMVSELVSAYRYKKDEVEKKKTKLEWKKDSWSDMNSKIYGFYTGSLGSSKTAGSFSNMKTTDVSDPTKADITANGMVPNGTQTLEVLQIAKASYLTGKEINGSFSNSSKLIQDMGLAAGKVTLVDSEGEEHEIEIDENTTIGDFVNSLKEAGLTASFDSKYNRFFINSKETGEASNFSFKCTGLDELANLDALGLATKENYVDAGVEAPAKFAAYQEGTNCKIKLNGAEFESATNTNTINGLTITAKAETEGAISVTTNTDVDGIYDKIKGVITEFNSLIVEMSKAYNAEAAKGYEPLSDEEKKAMTDDQIEQWEKKIKDSILRKDSTLNDVMTLISNAFSSAIEIDADGDGKTEKYSLATFGIKTEGYFVAADNEEKTLHIDGDKEDGKTALNADKLRTAIAENPELVSTFFGQLYTKVYNAIGDKMKSSSISSAFKVYNDKQMDQEIKDIDEELKKWETKIKDYEDYWYKKFSAMEKAMSNLQSSQNALAQIMSM